MLISHSKFINNSAPFVMVYATDSNNTSINKIGRILKARDTKLIIRYGEFVGNNASVSIVEALGRVITSVDYSKFTNNTGRILYTEDASMISMAHSEFVDNSVSTDALINLYGDKVSVRLSEFINNKIYDGVIFIRYHILAKNLTISKNVFIDNSAAYDVFISSYCKPGFSSSFGSPRCIKCPRNWYKNIVIIVIVNIVAGISLVIFMLALNMTVAVGTLNGILFYAHIVAANAETYFFPFLTPNIITVFISWLNLDVGLDVCIFERLHPLIKGLTQLAFPAYIILLVIIVIVASECSSKFSKIIGKGNPVAVLATMILLSYAKFLNAILGSIYLFYFGPAYGSRNVDLAMIGRGGAVLKQESNSMTIYASFLTVVSILIFFLGIVYNALITFWQFFVRYHDKVTCKWVRYQKLRHFIEPIMLHIPQNITIGLVYYCTYVLLYL